MTDKENNEQRYVVHGINNDKIEFVDKYSVRAFNRYVEFIKRVEQIKRKELLDKIKDEIMDTGAYEQEVNGKTEFLKGVNYCLGVLDKYRLESEE